MTEENEITTTLSAPANQFGRRDVLKLAGASAAVLGLTAAGLSIAKAQDMSEGQDNFYTSDQVTLEKVTFPSQFGLRVAGNLFIPNNIDRTVVHPALVVGHPMGAVKEQAANLYATKMAERGFVALAIDLLHWGESEGQPRNAVAPDAYSESFSAAVDFLSTHELVNAERIGGIGVCGSGGFLISAAKIDPRLKAVATASMYDMGAVTRNGYGNSRSVEDRKALAAQASQQRIEEFTTGEQVFMNGLPVELPADADPVTAMYWDFYRTPRGIAIPEGRTLELTQNRTLAGEIKFLNFYPFNDIETISPRPLLLIAGDQAHSRNFSEEAYRLAAEPKELFWIEGANHVDLYDNVNYIPWDKMESFFDEHLAA
jgi:fermentation-respiration switch protein FrsA (DUF1100 family)